MCRCGASDHIMTDKHCPVYHVDDEQFVKKIKGINASHAKKADKASKFEKCKPHAAVHFNNASLQQSTIINQKDNTDGNGYNKEQRR